MTVHTAPFRPVTPLPWSVLDNTDSGRTLVHVETDCDHPTPGRPVCSIPKARIGDAEYLVEAANAYPTIKAERDELLAMVREWETTCPAPHKYDTKTADRLARTRALLAQLDGAK